MEEKEIPEKDKDRDDKLEQEITEPVKKITKKRKEVSKPRKTAVGKKVTASSEKEERILDVKKKEVGKKETKAKRLKVAEGEKVIESVEKKEGGLSSSALSVEGEDKKFDLKNIKVKSTTLKKLEAIEKRREQFFKNLAAISEVNPEKAENLLNQYLSNNSSVFAEANILGRKAQKKTIQIISAGKKGTDAYYLQTKPGGLYVRHEIKSILTPEKKTIDLHIIEAEAQHKIRLAKEKPDERTWHKTTIIKSPENPWPFSKYEEKESKAPDEILKEAEDVLNNLARGSRTPLEPKINQTLKSWGMEPPKKTKAKGNKDKGKSDDKMKTRVTRKSREEMPTDDLSGSDTEAPKKISASKDPPKYLETLKLAGAWQFFKSAVVGHTHSTDSLKSSKSREDVEEEAESEKTDSKKEIEINELHRLLIVTERVTVANVLGDKAVVLDRAQGGQFVAHWKDPAPDVEKDKEGVTPRRHWYLENAIRTEQLPSPEGNTRLHLAVRMGDVRLVTAFLGLHDDAKATNSQKETPLHLAAREGNTKIADLLLKNGAEVNAVDQDSNTPLHIAASNDDKAMVQFLLVNGADVSLPDKSGLKASELAKDETLKNLLETKTLGKE